MSQKLQTPSNDIEINGLNPGTAYDRSRMVLVGWRNEAGEIDAPEGYIAEHFWNSDGKYLGPDANGIIPVYAIRGDNQ